MATEYFQSSLLAQEMEDTWTGTVRFNAEQGLSESQKAQARENIGAVPFGSNLKILGHFNTVAELQASAPQNVGDAYSVGAAAPYNLYIFDGLRNEWLNYGQIRAADISSHYVENQVIAVSAWTEDTSTIAGFNYKAQITISGATGNDFPIVAFSQGNAVSGNFAALAFSNNGHIEIFAKTKPTVAVTIPIATLIVNGGNGRGITNATGGIAAGSIGTANLANGSVTAPKIADGAVTRAKLAQDALYSPITRPMTTTYNVVASDLGKTIVDDYSTRNNNLTWNLSKSLLDSFPRGAEIAFARVHTSQSITLNITGARIINADSGQVGGASQTVSFSLPERGSMCALKKLENDSTYGSFWILTGNVEVVS